jgi:hypothetical protein
MFTSTLLGETYGSFKEGSDIFLGGRVLISIENRYVHAIN